MRRSDSSWSIFFAFTFVLAAGMATAGVFARVHSPEDAIRLWKLDEEGGGVFVLGKVLSRQTLAANLPDLGAVEVTRIEIAVSDYAGRRSDIQSTVSAYHLGGTQYQTSAQPSDAATKPGTEAAFLLRPNPDSKAVNAAWVIDGQNSVFAGVRSASGALTLIGQGSGSVIPEIARADQFMTTHREALQRVLSGKGKK